MQFEEIKEILIKEDPEFRKIAMEHKRYDEELIELSKRKFLTAEEQLREVELKKKKLALKDQMLKMASEYKKAHGK